MSDDPSEFNTNDILLILAILFWLIALSMQIQDAGLPDYLNITWLGLMLSGSILLVGYFVVEKMDKLVRE